MYYQNDRTSTKTREIILIFSLIMKITLVNTLLYFLTVDSISAKTRINDGISTRQEDIIPHNHLLGKNIFLEGRSEGPECGRGSGGSMHHSKPCDEDVDSTGIYDSDSISTRYDPVTKAPNQGTDNPAEACVSSERSFGQTSTVTETVSYLYEMQTKNGTKEGRIRSFILPTLEEAIVNSILGDIFPEICPSTAIGKRKEKRSFVRSLNGEDLEVIGVSMHPPDEITSNSKCHFSWCCSLFLCV